MKTIELQVPEGINESEIKLMLAALLYQKGMLTAGRAAAFADITKRQFLESVGKFGVSIFGETPADLEKEFGDD